MNYKVRFSKTGSNKTQVQIVYYHNRKTIVVKHLGSATSELDISRILEPNSKRESLNFLNEFVDKNHSLDSLYKQITKYNESKKESRKVFR